jgi:lipopolysaccharide export system permease protein
MLNVWQLDSVADSTKRLINRRIINLKTQAIDFFYSRTNGVIKSKSVYPLVNIHQFYDSLNTDEYAQAMQNAFNITRTSSGYVDGSESNIKSESSSLINFLIEWHKKIVVCFACIILFFIGAPLGAIIKKGGLGMPVVISVFFFLAYYILTELFMNLALEGALPPWQALWMPLLIFLPISIFLTSKAAKDSVIFDATIYYTWINKLFKKKASD